MLKHVIFLAALALAHGQESYVQNLLGSELQGETLLKAYDAHYDGLTPEAQMGEKGQYPKEVYEYLLNHRKRLV